MTSKYGEDWRRLYLEYLLIPWGGLLILWGNAQGRSCILADRTERPVSYSSFRVCNPRPFNNYPTLSPTFIGRDNNDSCGELLNLFGFTSKVHENRYHCQSPDETSSVPLSSHVQYNERHSISCS